MMNYRYAAMALWLLLLCSCGKSGHIDPEQLDFIPEFDENGYAVAYTDGMPIVIDRDYVAKTPLMSNFEYIGEYAIGLLADSSMTRLYDSEYNVVDSALEYFTGVSSNGVIWLRDVDGDIVARDVRNGVDILREKDAEVKQVTDAGTVVLRRCGPEIVEIEVIETKRLAYNFMIADADGIIKAPWGRFRYIEEFSCGLAKFTNGAYYCQMRTGLFANDDFSDNLRTSTKKFGYIDENGKVVIPERYDKCDAFDSDGHARADEECGDSQPNIIIDSEGNIVGRYRPSKGGLY